MDTIPLPHKIELAPGEKSGSATLTIEPLFPGYGTTLGNALRRVLLSSLPGAAVTEVKIAGALHEFTTIPNVKEDVLDVILNLKQLRVRLQGEEPAKLTIAVKGARKITAKDIERNARVEVVNSDLHIATTTDPQATFEAELTVEMGRGYLPTEERRKSEREAGVIAIDALFSPVRSVGLKIENVRVGQQTNFDKVVMKIDTDGTLPADDAIRQSVEILLAHFGLLQNVSQAEMATVTASSPDLALGEPVIEAAAPVEEVVEEEKPKKRGRKKKAE